MQPRALLTAPFEAGIATAAMVSSIVYLLDPGAAGTSALGKTAQALTPAWEALYAVGGALILVGLLRSLRLEAAGLSLFIAAVLIQSIAVLDFAGVTGAVTATTFAALAAAGVARIYVLWRTWQALVRGGR